MNNGATITTNVETSGTITSNLVSTGDVITSNVSAGATGSPGPTGSQGPIGPNGPVGPGVPAGGTTGQILKKNSNSDYDTDWGTGGGGGTWGSITGTLSDQIDLQAALDAKANDNAVVHLAGPETITGDKTFNSTLTLGSAYDLIWLDNSSTPDVAIYGAAALGGSGGRGKILLDLPGGGGSSSVQGIMTAGPFLLAGNFGSNGSGSGSGYINSSSSGSLLLNTDNTGAVVSVWDSTSTGGTASGGNIELTPDTLVAIYGSLDMNAHKINNVTDPTSTQDAATKNYVDNVAQGLSPKPSVRVATTGSETFTIASGNVTQISGTTVDGVSPAVGDRILIKDAPASTGAGSANSTQPGNGIYTVTSNTTNLSVSRAVDMDDANDPPAGAYAFVEAGTVNGSGGYVVSTPSSGAAFTYGSGNIKWTQFSAAGSYTGGTGISVSGLVISLSTPVAVANGGTGISSFGTGVATWLGTPSSANLAAAITDETGSGALVFATSPTLVTPALGTPSSATLTNATGLPIASGVSGLGSGVATFLATPSSANLATALTDETGSGALVFATSPTLVTPVLGVAAATSINKLTLTTPATAATLTIANNKTLTASNSLTLAGTDATVMTFPTTSASIARIDAAQSFTGLQTFLGATLSEGKVDIASQAVTDYEGSARIRIEDADGTNSDMSFRVAAANYSSINFAGSGGTLAVPTASANTDQLGGISAWGHDGSAYQNNAQMEFKVDGAVSTGIVPTLIRFTTTDSAGATGEVLKLAHDKAVTTANNTLDDGTGKATFGRVNKVAITAPASSAVLTIADGKTLTASNSLTLAGTDSTIMTFPSSSGTVATLAATQTLTNKRITRRVGSVASSATPSINTDNYDVFEITALAAAITSMTTNLTGTPNDGDNLIIRIKDNGTARAITWGASFTSSGVATLLATTVSGKQHMVALTYDSTAAKWVCMAVDATGY